MQLLQGLFPLAFGIQFAVDLLAALAHDFHYALVFACIQPVTVLCKAVIEFQVIEAILEFVQMDITVRAGEFGRRLMMDQRTFMFILVKGHIFQPIQFAEIKPHTAAVGAVIHFDHALVKLFDKGGSALWTVHKVIPRMTSSINVSSAWLS